jgi:hypothetical protein
VKRTEAAPAYLDFPAVGPGTGRVCVTGTGCHRHGMCDQDGMCHRELLGTIHYAPAGAYSITRFRPPGWPGGYFICVGVACLHVSGVNATDSTFPYAASQPNLYIDSARSGASPKIQSIYYDYCTHTKFYNAASGVRARRRFRQSPPQSLLIA